MASGCPLANPNTAEEDGLSLRKQRLLEQYAAGGLSWREAAIGIGRICPAPVRRPLLHRLAFVLAAFVAAVVIPPWARRSD
jgi:hypothetical protein